MCPGENVTLVSEHTMVAGGRGAQRRLPPEGVPTTDSTPKGVTAELAPAHGVRTSLGRFSGDVVAALLNHRLVSSAVIPERDEDSLRCFPNLGKMWVTGRVIAAFGADENRRGKEMRLARKGSLIPAIPSPPLKAAIPRRSPRDAYRFTKRSTYLANRSASRFIRWPSRAA
jgi:hypothetical protein